jgi:hypothetical protein
MLESKAKEVDPSILREMKQRLYPAFDRFRELAGLAPRAPEPLEGKASVAS